MDGKILRSTHGSWKGASQHINVLELLAAERALRCFADDLRNKVVRMEVDNTVALAYLRRFSGRVSSLRRIARRIFELCQRNNIHLLPQYLSSAENAFADHLSRTGNLRPNVATALGLTGSVTFPIPKMQFLSPAVTIAKHTHGALLTPVWSSAPWWQVLVREASRRHEVPASATSLSPDHKLAQAGRLMLWDFSKAPRWGGWTTASGSAQPSHCVTCC